MNSGSARIISTTGQRKIRLSLSSNKCKRLLAQVPSFSLNRDLSFSINTDKRWLCGITRHFLLKNKENMQN
jgi:hypothetical protein